jgi:dihydrodipicolinate synthase/N-acetylneuraminate lyase
MPMKNDARTKWNAENYVQVKVHINPELAVNFKKACVAADVSMASVISQFMAEYCMAPKVAKPKPTKPDYSTRGKRRVAVRYMTLELEEIMNAEEDYKDAIPENLQSGCAYESAEETVELMEAAIDNLYDTFQ